MGYQDMFIVYQTGGISTFRQILIQKYMNETEASLLTSEDHNQHIQKESDQIKFLSIFKYASQSERRYMIIGTIASILSGITFPLFLMFFGQITDLLTDKSTSESKGIQIGIKFIIIGAAYWFLTFVALYCWSYSGSTQSMKLKKLYYHTLIQQEVAWYDQNDVGKLASKIAKNISTIQNAIGQKIALLISAIVNSGFAVIFAFFHCWELSLFLSAVLPLMIYTGFLLMRSHGLRAKINRTSYEKASGIAEQAFQGIKTVKYLVGQLFEVDKFSQALSIGKDKSLRYIIYASIFIGSFTLVQFGIYSIGMWLGKEVLLWNLGNGRYTAADIVGTLFCFASGGAGLGVITPILKNLAQGKEAFIDLMELVNRRKDLDEQKGTKIIKKIKEITLNNVFFTYKGINQQQLHQTGILNNISIRFLPKKVSAIVGESGSGKSTIVQLLMRYYDCSKGSILINNQNIRNVKLSNLRRKIGFVGQEPILFAMSIQDNLKIANSKLTEDQIIQALKKANAWEFVSKMQKGIKTYVGSGGTQLSGGQKQRIAIARAICKNPQLLILDQATSALDRKNEKQIQQTLQHLSSSNITTIVIAHRLSTIKHADRIFVLQKGWLKEQGTHSQLLSMKGIYSRLVSTQLLVEQKGIITNEKIKDHEQDEQELSQDQFSIKSIQNKLRKQQTKAKQISLKQKAVFRKLLKKCEHHKLPLVIGCACSFINGAAVPLFSIVFGNILILLTDVQTNQDEINSLCLYFLLIALGASATSFLYNFMFSIVGDRLVYDLRINIFQKLLKMPMKYFDKKENTPGSISTKLSIEAYQIHNMVTGVLAVICLNSTTIIIGLLIGLVNCWQVALITLAFTPFLMIASSIHMSIVKRMASKSQRTERLIGSLISDTVSNIRTVKSFGRNKFFIKKFEENLQELSKLAFEKSLKVSFFQGMRRAFLVIANGLLFLIIGVLYSKGILNQSIQSIYVAIFAVLYSSNTIGQSSQYLPDMTRAKRSGAILFEILQSKDQQELSIQQGGILKQDIRGKIEFRNINFKYPERDAKILQDFNLLVNEMQKIGLVGQSGSGKSTIIQLLMRLYNPTSGQIFLNQRNIKDYELYHLRRQLGIVNQQPTMFKGTISENICYNEEVDLKKMESVIQISCCKKFIEESSHKFEKEVGHKGSQISGGQKQRLAIARCLYRNPSVMLFDEATSALDAQTESLLFTNLKDVLSKVTSISVAHRLSTIQDCSRIIVMKEGKIIQHGTYNELLHLRGNFYNLARGK